MSADADLAAWIAAVLLLDIVLGGAAAANAGRALARTWRPFSLAPLFMAPLAAAIGFLHYAIFGVSPIPLYDMGNALASLPDDGLPALARFGEDGLGWLAIGVALTCYAFVGYRMTRRAQMAGRYDWLFEKAGVWSWRERRIS